FANLLSGIEAQFPPEEIGKSYSQFKFETGEEVTPPFDNFLNFLGVLCADSNNPLDPEFWPLVAQWNEYENGYFGRSWTWSSSGCVTWPGSQKNRYIGPFNKKTKNTVLVASTLYDPATPYSGAKAVAKLLPNSRLVTVVGWGHTTPGLSLCADQITANYLLKGDVPEKDTICHQGFSPFDLTTNTADFAKMSEAAGISENPTTQHTTANTVDSDAAQVRKAILRNMRWH
ncbi:MAG: alpha/beta fold hydrolase, partial [Chitinophagaceae bacterium]